MERAERREEGRNEVELEVRGGEPICEDKIGKVV